MKTIFDIGSNNGDDIPYYLLKADLVVAFEANPQLCREISERFRAEIDAGRLIVKEGVISTETDATSPMVDFYIHKTSHVLSQFPKPEPEQEKHFERHELPVLTLTQMIGEFGVPHYAKIDIEHYDQYILHEFFRLEAYPDYISAECHTEEVVSLLCDNPLYKGFKLVVGSAVPTQYADAEVTGLDGERKAYSFPMHSAGPFGADIAGPWYDKATIRRKIAVAGLGWRDLHASRIDQGESDSLSQRASDYWVRFKKFVKALNT